MEIVGPGEGGGEGAEVARSEDQGESADGRSSSPGVTAERTDLAEIPICRGSRVVAEHRGHSFQGVAQGFGCDLQPPFPTEGRDMALMLRDEPAGETVEALRLLNEEEDPGPEQPAAEGPAALEQAGAEVASWI